MKNKYSILHPDYKFRENEILLEEMAKNGWILESITFSVAKFAKAEPRDRKYKILLKNSQKESEVASEILRFKDAGWNLFQDHNKFYIFYLDEHMNSSAAMEVSKDLQIESIMNIRKGDFIGLIFMVAIFFINFNFFQRDRGFIIQRFIYFFFTDFYEMLVLLILLIFVLYISTKDRLHMSRSINDYDSSINSNPRTKVTPYLIEIFFHFS